jgi:hypothetical protein
MSQRLLPAIDISGDRVTPGCWTSRPDLWRVLKSQMVHGLQGSSHARFSLTTVPRGTFVPSQRSPLRLRSQERISKLGLLTANGGKALSVSLLCDSAGHLAHGLTCLDAASRISVLPPASSHESRRYVVRAMMGK